MAIIFTSTLIMNQAWDTKKNWYSTKMETNKWVSNLWRIQVVIISLKVKRAHRVGSVQILRNRGLWMVIPFPILLKSNRILLISRKLITKIQFWVSLKKGLMEKSIWISKREIRENLSYFQLKENETLIILYNNYKIFD